MWLNFKEVLSLENNVWEHITSETRREPLVRSFFDWRGAVLTFLPIPIQPHKRSLDVSINLVESCSLSQMLIRATKITDTVCESKCVGVEERDEVCVGASTAISAY